MAQVPNLNPAQMQQALAKMQQLQKKNNVVSGTIKGNQIINQYIQTLVVKNVSKDESTVTNKEFASNINKNDVKYIMSDADEELLILIEFREEMDLESITFYASSLNGINPDLDDDDIDDITYSQPKDIKIYKIDNLNKDFNDAKSKKADIKIKCNSNKLNSNKGNILKLKKNAKSSIKFGKIKCLMIFIESNQNDTEQTYINAIKFKGNNPNQKTDMSRWNDVKCKT